MRLCFHGDIKIIQSLVLWTNVSLLLLKIYVVFDSDTRTKFIKIGVKQHNNLSYSKDENILLGN